MGGWGLGGQKKYIWEKSSKESGIPTQLSENSPCQSLCLKHTATGTAQAHGEYHTINWGMGGWAGRGEELLGTKAAWESGTQDEELIHFNISHFQVHSRCPGDGGRQ